MNHQKTFYSSLSTVAPTAQPIYFYNVDYVQGIDSSYTTDCVCGLNTNHCVGTTYCWYLYKSSGKFTSASISINCNGTTIRSCSIGGISGFNCNGTFSVFTQSYGDSIVISTSANDGTYISGTEAGITLCSLTQCVGTYCIGYPSSDWSYAGLV